MHLLVGVLGRVRVFVCVRVCVCVCVCVCGFEHGVFTDNLHMVCIFRLESRLVNLLRVLMCFDRRTRGKIFFFTPGRGRKIGQ